MQGDMGEYNYWRLEDQAWWKKYSAMVLSGSISENTGVEGEPYVYTGSNGSGWQPGSNRSYLAGSGSWYGSVRMTTSGSGSSGGLLGYGLGLL